MKWIVQDLSSGGLPPEECEGETRTEALQVYMQKHGEQMDLNQFQAFVISLVQESETAAAAAGL